MDRKLEQIISNRLRAQEELNKFEVIKQTLRDEDWFGLFLTEEVERKINDRFEKANGEFWNAFDYSLQVFDLENGDLPNERETVYVYDEIDGKWIKAEISSYCHDGALRFTKGFQVLGSPNGYERYTRWARLPILASKAD